MEVRGVVFGVDTRRGNAVFDLGPEERKIDIRDCPDKI